MRQSHSPCLSVRPTLSIQHLANRSAAFHGILHSIVLLKSVDKFQFRLKPDNHKGHYDNLQVLMVASQEA